MGSRSYYMPKRRTPKKGLYVRVSVVCIFNIMAFVHCVNLLKMC